MPYKSAITLKLPYAPTQNTSTWELQARLATGEPLDGMAPRALCPHLFSGNNSRTNWTAVDGWWNASKYLPTVGCEGMRRLTSWLRRLGYLARSAPTPAPTTAPTTTLSTARHLK